MENEQGIQSIEVFLKTYKVQRYYISFFLLGKQQAVFFAFSLDFHILHHLFQLDCDVSNLTTNEVDNHKGMGSVPSVCRTSKGFKNSSKIWITKFILEIILY